MGGGHDGGVEQVKESNSGCTPPRGVETQRGERVRDYRGAPHDTCSFRATPGWPTLPRADLDLPWTVLPKNAGQVGTQMKTRSDFERHMM